MSSHAYGGDPPGLAGKHHWGVGSVGIRGDALAVGGFIAPSVNLPADAAKEYYAVLTPAAGLTLLTGEPGDYDASANDGTYVSPFDLYEWGAYHSSSTLTNKFAWADMTGSNTSGASTSSTGSITVTPAAGTVRTMTGQNTSGGSASSTGSIGVTPAAPGVVNLTGQNTSGASTSSTGAMSVTAAAPAPVGRDFSMSYQLSAAVRADMLVVYSLGSITSVASRTVVFEGGKRTVNFEGGQRLVRF